MDAGRGAFFTGYRTAESGGEEDLRRGGRTHSRNTLRKTVPGGKIGRGIVMSGNCGEKVSSKEDAEVWTIAGDVEKVVGGTA